MSGNSQKCLRICKTLFVGRAAGIIVRKRCSDPQCIGNKFTKEERSRKASESERPSKETLVLGLPLGDAPHRLRQNQVIRVILQSEKSYGFRKFDDMMTETRVLS